MRIKKWVDFFLYSNIFISLCAAAITAETYLLAHSEINWLYIVFVFFSTLVLYCFPSLSKTSFSTGHPGRHTWIWEHKNLLQIFSVIGIIASGTLSFFFPFKFILSFIPVALIAFAYFIPQTHLRSIAGLKAGVVTLVWTSVSAVFPILLISDFDLSRTFGNANGMILLQNFLFIFPLCIIFNVKDIDADRKVGVKTFPIIYGVKWTVVICLISLILFSAVVIMSENVLGIKSALLLSAASAAVFLLFASEERSDYYYSFWIDGMILLQAGMVLIVNQ